MTNDQLQDARSALNSGDLDRAFTILNSMMTGGVVTPEVLSLLAQAFHAGGMETEAAEVLERAALFETPEASTFLLNAMQLYYKTQNREKAFLLSLQLNKVIPDHQDVVFILVEGFLERGEMELVEAYKHKLVNSSNPDHLALASRLVGNAGFSEDHLTLYKKLYAIAPEQGQILFSLMEFAAVFHDFDTLAALEARLAKEYEAGNLELFRSDFPRHSLMWTENEAINQLAQNANDMPARPDGLDVIRRVQPHDWNERISIGYVSDFGSSNPDMTLLRPVLAAHDPDRFEITLLDLSPSEAGAPEADASRQPGRIVPLGDMDDQAAATAISDLGIDILVDLKGYTGGGRPGLFNQLAAPVQVSWLGFPGTAANLDLDYIVADPIVLPDSSKPYYHEKFCRLPETFHPNGTEGRLLPEPRSRRELALPEGKFVLAAFCPPDQVSPATIGLWLQIMKKAPDSVLWLQETSSLARQNLTRHALLQGIMPNRLIFAPAASYADHLARIQAADLALDTFPFNGQATTSDLLWAGIPVVTKKGGHFASRISQSLLCALDMAELVAETDEGFVDLAAGLAGDRNRLNTIREKLAVNRYRAPLFDAERFCRHLEKAYEMMAERAKSGLDPDHMDVPALPRRESPFTAR